jgi:hypothetical protein
MFKSTASRFSDRLDSVCWFSLLNWDCDTTVSSKFDSRVLTLPPASISGKYIAANFSIFSSYCDFGLPGVAARPLLLKNIEFSLAARLIFGKDKLSIVLCGDIDHVPVFDEVSAARFEALGCRFVSGIQKIPIFGRPK